MTPPKKMNGTEEPVEVQVARLQERQQEDRADIAEVCGKVDKLCEDVAPVVAWVTAQMLAATESKRWWDGLVKDALTAALKNLLTIVAVGVATGVTMMWANPAEASRLFGGIWKVVAP